MNHVFNPMFFHSTIPLLISVEEASELVDSLTEEPKESQTEELIPVQSSEESGESQPEVKIAAESPTKVS